MAKARTGKARVRAESDLSAENQGVTLPLLINVFANELVQSRVRFRALLQLLVSKGFIQEEDYVSAFEAEEESSFMVLADMLLLSPRIVQERHQEWLASERGRFMSMSRKRPRPRIDLKPQSAIAKDN